MPVNVVTGALFDVALDLRIEWDVPFVWRRYYDSSRVTAALPLGWGHTHSYDHRLEFDLDGLTYVTPAGVRHGFGLPGGAARVSASPAAQLRQVGRAAYRVKASGEPAVEFEFTHPERPARLTRVYRGAAFQQLHYDESGQWAALTFGNEPPLLLHSDAGGRIVGIDWSNDGSAPRAVWRGEYDGAGNLVRVTDARGNAEAFAYDALNRMTGRRDRNGYGFAMQYDRVGRCAWSAGEDGLQAVGLRFHTDDRHTVVTRADGGAWAYHHLDRRVIRIVDPYGGVTRRDYGPDGALVQETGPEGEVLRTVVDAETGFVASPYGPPDGMALPIGDPWFVPAGELAYPREPIGWDGFGARRDHAAIRLPARDAYRAWGVSLPGAALAALQFAEGGSVPREAAGPGPVPPRFVAEAIPARPDHPMPKKPMARPAHAGRVLRDAFGLVLGNEQPDGSRCRWQYDGNGNAVRYVDHAGSEWRYDYASWNLLVRETDPLGGATSFGYGPTEQLVSVEDPGGTRTERGFDLKDRMVTRARDGKPRDRFRHDLSAGIVAAGGPEAEERVAFLPGPHGRPLLVAPQGAPERRCAYDDRGRLLAVTSDEGAAVAFAYDKVGHRVRDTQGGRSVERVHEGLLLAEITVLGRYTIQYRRDDDSGGWSIMDPMGGRHAVRQLDGGVFLLERATGVKEVVQYDWNGRCRAKVRFRGSESYAVWSRSYRYSAVGTLLTETDSLAGATSYRYDAAHRLVGAQRARGETQHFAYDAAGNLLAAPSLSGATHSGNRLVSANGRRLTYNARDAVIAEWDDAPVRRYRYDAEDRLVECETPAGRVAFEYDGLGRRLAKTSGQGRTEFVWDGERLAAEIAPSGALRIYVYADGDAMSPFAFVDYASAEADPATGVMRHVFTNQVSCPVLVEDGEGRVLWRAEHEPYGATKVTANAQVSLNLRWPGHYFDEETGLHYNRHRYYSPVLGRYIQVDPRDIEGGVNLYGYPARPLDMVDVDGLAPCPKKAMVEADEKDKKFQKAKREAEEVADNMRKALQEAVDKGEVHPLNAAGVTLATMVVKRKDGTYEVVVTGNVNPARMPQRVLDEFDGIRVVGHGDDRPPPVGKDQDDWRFPRTRPDGETDPSTHKHAEQRGLRAVDCDKDAEGVAFIAPTRPCCEGCSTAIQTPAKKNGTGGWGGDSDNVSDFGRKPGQHGDHW
ncbi:RHS repeat protein [Roseomonas sp. JC162]|uniref:RHS repeat protein n=1 Tax=Neoroseomonas marina TaxID=1232220 RepID=A0A848ELH4_9PROT|nr:RHS repeat-associated core domain-containing protein [Neoroseomonas marina]NMJ44385.1 RHS repeat protein [Neoroseomonas marina]